MLVIGRDLFDVVEKECFDEGVDLKLIELFEKIKVFEVVLVGVLRWEYMVEIVMKNMFVEIVKVNKVIEE